MTNTIILSKVSANPHEIVYACTRGIVSLDAQMDYEPPVMPSFFQLEYFDDRTYETRTAKEWIELNNGYPVEAHSLWHRDLRDGNSEWKDVLVIELNTVDV